MQVLSVRCGVTKNMGNYESKKLEIEAAPSDGQTAESLLTEVNEYLNKQLVDSGAPAARPPLKNAVATVNENTKVEKKQAEPTIEIGTTSSPNVEPKPKRSTAKAKAQAAQFEKEKAKRVQYAIEAESLAELHERMTELRDFGNAFTPDEWQSVNEKLAARYRELPKDNVEMQDAITKAFKSEKNILAEWRRMGTTYTEAKEEIESVAA